MSASVLAEYDPERRKPGRLLTRQAGVRPPSPPARGLALQLLRPFT
jgi:hypothetical protein